MYVICPLLVDFTHSPVHDWEETHALVVLKSRAERGRRLPETAAADARVVAFWGEAVIVFRGEERRPEMAEEGVLGAGRETAICRQGRVNQLATG